MGDSPSVAFRKWFIEKVRAFTFPRESSGSYDVAPGLFKLHTALATVAGGEVARLRGEGCDDETIRVTLKDERSLDIACDALDLMPGTLDYSMARGFYTVAVDGAIELLNRLYPRQGEQESSS